MSKKPLNHNHNKRFSSPGTPSVAPPLTSVKVVRPNSFSTTAAAAAGHNNNNKSPMSFSNGGGAGGGGGVGGGAEREKATTSPSLKNYTISNFNNDTTLDNTLAQQPLLTPNRSGTAMSLQMMMSPSKTLTEGLGELTQMTGRQLDKIWDEVGYSPEDRAAQLNDLFVQFHHICKKKINEERKVAETCKSTIKEHKAEIRQLVKALQTNVDPNLLDSHSIHHRQTTLTFQLEALDTVLEGLKGKAKTVRNDLKVCRDFLIEAHDALGMDMDPKWRDIDSDLTEERMEDFNRKRNEMKEELSSRTATVISSIRACKKIMKCLGIEVGKPGCLEIDERIAGSLERSGNGSYIMTSKYRTQTCVGISSVAVDELTKRMGDLQKELEKRKEVLDQLGEDIRSLWFQLHVPKQEQEAFAHNFSNWSEETIERGKAELERLLDLKKKMLGDLIDEKRAKISDLWEQMNTPLDQRSSFEPFYVDNESLFDDELLDQHEKYAELLEVRFEEMKPIIKLIQLREDILHERMEYEELQKDPGRLTQRGAGVSKQLEKEEEMAKGIKKLPQKTKELEQILHDWKEDNGEDLVYRNEVYLKVMEQQEDEWKQYKEEEKQRKLKKKQKEQPRTNNYRARHHASKARGNGGRAQLGDARGRENAGRQQQQQQQPRKQPSKNRGSHEVPPVTPKRALGNKQNSTRF